MSSFFEVWAEASSALVIAAGHSDSRPHHTHTNNKSTSESISFMTSNLGTHSNSWLPGDALNRLTRCAPKVGNHHFLWRGGPYCRPPLIPEGLWLLL